MGAPRGVFETLRCDDGVPRFVERHLARLEHGARALALPWPPPADLRETLATLAREHPRGSWRLRLALVVDERGPVLAADAQPRADPPAPVVLWTAPEGSFLPSYGVKSMERSNHVRWRAEARARDAWDALLRDGRGAVLEATVANFFLALDGRLVTPPLDAGVLPGIVRALLLEDIEREPLVVGGVSWPAEERCVDGAHLSRASEVLVTNALVGVLGADAVSGVPRAGSGLPGGRGPVARELRARLERLAGEDHRDS